MAYSNSAKRDCVLPNKLNSNRSRVKMQSYVYVQKSVSGLKGRLASDEQQYGNGRRQNRGRKWVLHCEIDFDRYLPIPEVFDFWVQVFFGALMYLGKPTDVQLINWLTPITPRCHWGYSGIQWSPINVCRLWCESTTKMSNLYFPWCCPCMTSWSSSVMTIITVPCRSWSWVWR